MRLLQKGGMIFRLTMYWRVVFDNTFVVRNLDERSDEPEVVESMETQNVPTPPPSQSGPVSSSGPERRVLRVPRQQLDSIPSSGSASTGSGPDFGLLRASQKLVVKRSNM